MPPGSIDLGDRVINAEHIVEYVASAGITSVLVRYWLIAECPVEDFHEIVIAALAAKYGRA